MENIFACALILAGGKGTRMHSTKPKVLKTLLGESMLHYVYKAVTPSMGENIFTIVGFEADMVKSAFPHMSDNFVLQEEQLGTGHALQVGWDKIKASNAKYCVVVNGDTPLLEKVYIDKLLNSLKSESPDISFISITPSDPASFGRVVRNNQGDVSAIVEAKDYDESVYGPVTGEVNAGIYALKISVIDKLLNGLDNDNKSGEYYITDLVGMCVERKLKVCAFNCGDSVDLMGINSPLELAHAESELRKRVALSFLEQGVTLHNWESVVIGPEVKIAPGVEITGPCEIYGKSDIGAKCVVESHVRIVSSKIGAKTQIKAYSHLEDAIVGDSCSVGPYGRLRPLAVMEDEAKLGNFVEMKKATLGKGAKASHLSYLGDATIGAGANIGAGTITCNYDGKNKFKTEIGEGAFIGSNSALVAPVVIGKGALIGAGSTITKKVKDGDLAVSRARQLNIARTSKKS